jgi:apolipoprotein N-acyltransferase
MVDMAETANVRRNKVWVLVCVNLAAGYLCIPPLEFFHRCIIHALGVYVPGFDEREPYLEIILLSALWFGFVTLVASLVNVALARRSGLPKPVLVILALVLFIAPTFACYMSPDFAYLLFSWVRW